MPRPKLPTQPLLTCQKQPQTFSCEKRDSYARDAQFETSNYVDERNCLWWKEALRETQPSDANSETEPAARRPIEANRSITLVGGAQRTSKLCPCAVIVKVSIVKATAKIGNVATHFICLTMVLLPDSPAPEIETLMNDSVRTRHLLQCHKALPGLFSRWNTFVVPS